MGTRGLVGWKADDQIKMTYNHFDSYPSALGETMLKHVWTFLTLKREDRLIAKVKALVVVNEDIPPTPEQIRLLSRYHDGNVSTGQKTEWYSLLRDTQGDPDKILASGYLICDYIDGLPAFGFNSLFCEWGYLVDFDAGVFQVYKGFNGAQPAIAGIYAGMDRLAGEEYFPIDLVWEATFDNVAKMTTEQIDAWAAHIEETTS